jgi:non-ribosomal peptide synthetase component F
MGTHGATLNRLYWMWEAYPWCDGDVACLTSGLSFVDSVASIFGALLKGVPLVIVDDETLLDRDRLLKMLHANQVSRMTVVPSLRLCACSGEALPVGLAR